MKQKVKLVEKKSVLSSCVQRKEKKCSSGKECQGEHEEGKMSRMNAHAEKGNGLLFGASPALGIKGNRDQGGCASERKLVAQEVLLAAIVTHGAPRLLRALGAVQYWGARCHRAGRALHSPPSAAGTWAGSCYKQKLSSYVSAHKNITKLLNKDQNTANIKH